MKPLLLHVAVQEGDVVEGVVLHATSKTVCVDIGAGVTAQLHISQISGDQVTADDVSKIFAEGDKVKVRCALSGGGVLHSIIQQARHVQIV
jgi:ribosomal protein S1